MILGASELQVPAIIKAKEMGLYVIAVDINPKAPGFEYADMYELISTIDTLRILDAARKHSINGIITLASDKPMIIIIGPITIGGSNFFIHPLSTILLSRIFIGN